MLGAICGDVIGSVYEGHNVKSKQFPLFSKKTRFTDDTVLTCAVADAILNKKYFGPTIHRYSSQYPKAGFGEKVSRVDEVQASKALRELWKWLCYESKSNRLCL
jgi:ADP-ribosylglycohydrolase